MLYTVSELEPALAEADAEVAKIREALAEAEKMRAFIASRLERARAREAAGTESIVTHRKHSGTVNSDMQEAHRKAISRGSRRKKGGRRDTAFVDAFQAAGFPSQNAFATRLGVSVASLSRYRNDRPVPQETADKIKALTGFTGPWPAGIAKN
jgi:hypothetical protein